MLTAAVLTIIGLAFLMIVGTVVYGIVLAIGGGLGALIRDARGRLSKPKAVNGLVTTAQPPELSTETLWHRMQGTSRKERKGDIGP